MSFVRRVTRRSMLRGLTYGTAGVFARPLINACFAQESGPPRRLLVLYMPNCSIRASWLPTGGRTPGMNAGNAREFTLKNGNDTLAPAREQMTLITGLDAKQIQGCNHGSSIVRIMTGGGIKPVGMTFDQVMATRSPLFRGTQIASLQLGTDTRADNGSNGIQLRVMSYDGKSPLPPEIEPQKTFTRIFAGVVPANASADQKAELERALAEDRSVLDLVKRDLARLEQRLPGAQREKLDSHLEGLREVERGLRGTGEGRGVTGVTLPSPPEALAPNNSLNHPKVLDQYFAITKLALQLDVTRVITLMYASGNSQVSLGDFLPGYAKGALHRLAHAYKSAALVEATRWYCGLTAKFIGELAAIKEVDGSSLLDNTLVPFFSEVAQYHEHNDLPWALFGGKKLGHEGGRALRYPGRTPNDLWVSVAARLGVDLPTFGDAGLNQGALPELFA
jgi:hypothetical protein